MTETNKQPQAMQYSLFIRFKIYCKKPHLPLKMQRDALHQGSATLDMRATISMR